MESQSQRAHNKKSLLSVGVLMLSLAALQSPLWRSQSVMPISVRTGGAMLLSSDRPIADIVLDRDEQASAELVGEREVLIRGKAMGEAILTIASKDGHKSTYHVMVQSDSARSMWGSLGAR